MMTQTAERRYGLTPLGRVRAVLVELERRWPTLAEGDKAEALALVDRLADCYRARRVRVPLVGRISA